MARFDAAVLALARLGHTEVNRVIPIRPFLFQPRHEQAITFDHHLGIGRLHRELEVVETVLAADAGEFQRALDHAERRVAVAIHDAVGKRAVVRADAQAAVQPFGFKHERREFLFDPLQFSGVLLIGVFLGGKFLGIGVIARIHPHDLDPFHRFHRRFGLEMDVGDNRHEAFLRAQFREQYFADLPRP